MTAKEKAIELRDKMMLYSFEKTKLNENTTHIDFRYKISAEYAKQCAIIAVDVIIKNLHWLEDSINFDKAIKFWQEVKTELNKL